MAEPPANRDGRERAGLPRWAKVLGVVVAVVALLVVAVMLISGGGDGEHRPGPGRHGLDGGDAVRVSVAV